MKRFQRITIDYHLAGAIHGKSNIISSILECIAYFQREIIDYVFLIICSVIEIYTAVFFTEFTNLW